jgi:hypothetical protein
VTTITRPPGVSRLLAACDRFNRCHMHQAAGAIDLSPDDAIRLAALVMTAVTTDPASEGDVAAVERAVEAFLGRVGVASGEVN